MTILESIKNDFAVSLDKKDIAYSIKGLPENSRAWTIRQEDWYGVGVPLPNDQIISEQFFNAKLFTKEIVIAGMSYNMLVLCSTIEDLRNEFAVVCAQFVEPGEDESERRLLELEPVEWWRRWKSLLGNSIHNKPTYSVLGEMIVFKYLLESGLKPNWIGSDRSTHDIELSEQSFEVKSTISRYDLTVTINGQFQLLSRGKKLNLAFCRFEPSNLGRSINDLVEDLVTLGENRDNINSHLKKVGLELGSSARAEKFKILELRKFEVNEEFPAITPYTFKENKIPEAIEKIIYKIDLTSIRYETWNITN